MISTTDELLQLPLSGETTSASHGVSLITAQCKDEKKTWPGPDGESAEEIEAILAQEMNALSIHERDLVLVLYDVHGVSEEVEEAPELVKKGIVDLEICLRSIKKKIAFERALYMDRK